MARRARGRARRRLLAVPAYLCLVLLMSGFWSCTSAYSSGTHAVLVVHSGRPAVSLTHALERVTAHRHVVAASVLVPAPAPVREGPRSLRDENESRHIVQAVRAARVGTRTKPRVVVGAPHMSLGALIAKHVANNHTAGRRILVVAAHVAANANAIDALHRSLAKGIDAACAPVTTQMRTELLHSHLAFAPHPLKDFDADVLSDGSQAAGLHAPYDALEGYPAHAAAAAYGAGAKTVPSCAGAFVLLRTSAVARHAGSLAAYRSAEAVVAHVCLSSRSRGRRCVATARATAVSVDEVDGIAGLPLAVRRAELADDNRVGAPTLFPADLGALHHHFGYELEHRALGSAAHGDDEVAAPVAATNIHYSLECGTGQMLGLTLEAMAFLRVLEDAADAEHASRARGADAHANSTVRALGATRRRITATALVLSNLGSDVAACVRDLVPIAPAADIRRLRRLAALAYDAGRRAADETAVCILHHDPGRYHAAKQRLSMRFPAPRASRWGANAWNDGFDDDDGLGSWPSPSWRYDGASWDSSWDSGWGAFEGAGEEDDSLHHNWHDALEDSASDAPDVAPLQLPHLSSSWNEPATSAGVGEFGALTFGARPPEDVVAPSNPPFTSLVPFADDERDGASAPASALMPPPPPTQPPLHTPHALPPPPPPPPLRHDGAAPVTAQEHRVVYIGRSMYETNTVPDHWPAAAAEHVDEIWTPTEHARRAFTLANVTTRRSGDGKKRVVPELIDPLLFAPGAVDGHDEVATAADVEVVDASSDRTLLFGTELSLLSVFKWEARKGWDVLLRGYYDAFFDAGRGDGESPPPVSLHIRSSVDAENRRTLATFDAAYCRERVGANTSDVADCTASRLPVVTLLATPMDAGALARLYASVDAFVLATRGEGWGRPLHEAMAMGIPSVATAWAGTGELMGCNLDAAHDNATASAYAARLGVDSDTVVPCATDRGAPVAFPLPYQLVPMADDAIGVMRRQQNDSMDAGDGGANSGSALTRALNAVGGAAMWLARRVGACRRGPCTLGLGVRGADVPSSSSSSSSMPVPPIDDTAEHLWAEPDAAALARVLRVLRSRPDVRRRVGRAGQRRVSAAYAPPAVGRAMLDYADDAVVGVLL